MIGKVYKILKPLGYKVKWQLRPNLSDSSDAVLSYHFFGERYAFYGNGIGKQESGSLQVDVFSKDDYTKAVQKVQEALENSGFRLLDKRDSIEDLDSANRLYHKILIFSYAESEVK